MQPPLRQWMAFLGVLIGLMLAIVGYWGPWVDHAAAALVIAGFDLAEYVKFLPEVRAGSMPVIRELFYLAAPAAALCLALVLGNWQRHLPAWAWTALAALALWLALIVAPPVDFIVRFADATLRAEWGRQAALAGVGFLGVAAALLWARRLARWAAVSLFVLSAGTGTGVLLWQFFTVQPAIERVYNQPLAWGWGVWLMPLGFALAVVSACWRAF
ncbi:MAG: hypothetical protein ACOYZ7_16730 [Chloroflexota bacterium]